MKGVWNRIYSSFNCYSYVRGTTSNVCVLYVKECQHSQYLRVGGSFSHTHIFSTSSHFTHNHISTYLQFLSFPRIAICETREELENFHSRKRKRFAVSPFFKKEISARQYLVQECWRCNFFCYFFISYLKWSIEFLIL